MRPRYVWARAHMPTNTTQTPSISIASRSPTRHTRGMPAWVCAASVPRVAALRAESAAALFDRRQCRELDQAACFTTRPGGVWARPAGSGPAGSGAAGSGAAGSGAAGSGRMRALFDRRRPACSRQEALDRQVRCRNCEPAWSRQETAGRFGAVTGEGVD